MKHWHSISMQKDYKPVGRVVINESGIIVHVEQHLRSLLGLPANSLSFYVFTKQEEFTDWQY